MKLRKLEKELNKLEIKLNDLDKNNIHEDYQNLIAPIYTSKLIQIYSEYFGLIKKPKINYENNKKSN